MTDTDNKMIDEIIKAIDEFVTSLDNNLYQFGLEETKFHQIKDGLAKGKSLSESIDQIETIVEKIDWDLLTLKDVCRKFHVEHNVLEHLWELSSKYPDHDFKFCPDTHEVMYKLTLIDSDSEWEYFDPLVNYYREENKYYEDNEA